MNYLLDTNIILEILLDQTKAKQCMDFIIDNPTKLSLSDFSLHSIQDYLLIEEYCIIDAAEKIDIILC